MVHLSAFFIAVLGSSLVSALSVPTDVVEARADSDVSVDQTTGYTFPVNFVKGVTVHHKTLRQLKKGGSVTVEANINVSPVPVEVTLDSISALGTRGGVTYLSSGNYTFSKPVIISAFSTVSTGPIPLVKVVNDLQPIINSGLIDLTNGVINARAPTIAGAGGLPIKLTLKQSDIPFKVVKDPK